MGGCALNVPVVWLNLAQSFHRGYWDQGLLERLFAGELGLCRYDWTHYGVGCYDPWPEVSEGGVVVLAGSYHAERLVEVQERIDQMAWVLLLVTSDEEHLFAWRELEHPRMIVWLEPNPNDHYTEEDIRFLGVTCHPDTGRQLAELWSGAEESDVFFSGQITHARRQQMWAALQTLTGTPEIALDITATEGFTQGLPRDEYLRRMAASKVVPCPAGPGIADTFRFWEALEAQTLPIADARVEGEPAGYWSMLFSGCEPLPFPVIDNWADLPDYCWQLTRLTPADKPWPHDTNRAQAWYQQYKRSLRLRVEADIGRLSERQPESLGLPDLLTVIVPTSPIPSHPSLSVLDETLDSLEERLPGVEVIIAADGVRPEQEALRPAYEQYLRAMLASLAFRRHDCVPLLLSEWGHQANVTRAALELVRTPVILFVEHDCPLVGDLPAEELCRVIVEGEANVIRLSHEAQILDVHRHLMLGEHDLLGVPLTGTIQWSQRPHFALTAFYRRMLRTYFGRGSRTMIEDAMHGVLQAAADERGWGMWRTFIYTPDGDIKRSTTTDGRQQEPKFDMLFDYDGERPDYAPAPSSAAAQPGVGG